MLRRKLLLGMLIASCTFSNILPVYAAAPEETETAAEDIIETASESEETEIETETEVETIESEAFDPLAVLETVPYDPPTGYTWGFDQENNLELFRTDKTVPAIVRITDFPGTFDVEDFMIFVTNLETEETKAVHLTRDMDYQASLPWVNGYFKIFGGNLAWEDSSGQYWTFDGNRVSYEYIGTNFDSQLFSDLEEKIHVGDSDFYTFPIHEWKKDYELGNGQTSPYPEEEDAVTEQIAYGEAFDETKLIELQESDTEIATDETSSLDSELESEEQSLVSEEIQEDKESKKENAFLLILKRFWRKSGVFVILLIVLIPIYYVVQKRKQDTLSESNNKDEKALDHGRKVGKRTVEKDSVSQEIDDEEDGIE